MWFHQTPLPRGEIGVYIIHEDILSYHHSFSHHIIVCSHPHPFVHNTSFQAVRLYDINVWNSHILTYHLLPHISQRCPPPCMNTYIVSYQRLRYSSVWFAVIRSWTLHWAGWFESHFAWNPEDRFFCIVAQIVSSHSQWRGWIKSKDVKYFKELLVSSWFLNHIS